ncbi:PREDICTED: SKP1-like protein 18 [Camelina sativa]|uniref:SKP1-like protein n=1 Tax=Camelina sativa TaxID=90675 RepID=A0ABM0WTD8_CAMSA|nr:PREDICTED: SKP1-like protein 18 [Camelina sativa]
MASSSKSVVVSSKRSAGESSSSEIEEAVASLTMSSNKITLISSDGVSFEINEAVARQFLIVAHMIEDECADRPIPIENVTGDILDLVIEYGEKHVKKGRVKLDEEEEEEAKKKLDEWDKEFLKNIDLETVFRLILAANYLNYEGLLGFASQAVADHIKDLSPEEVREIFHIENDFTKEEEEAIRKENAWTFNENDK